jgi:hypothetical protein
MSNYRLYALDEDGCVRSAIALDARDDGSAVREARRIVNAFGVEIWDGRRRVRVLKGLF